MNAQAAFRYQQVSTHSAVQEASPHTLIQMLLKGALDKIAYAKGNMARNQVAEKGQNIGKAVAIVMALQNSLDLKIGGELASNLFLLYDYMTRKLIYANKENDPQALDEVSELLLEIKSGWDQIPEDIRTMDRDSLTGGMSIG